MWNNLEEKILEQILERRVSNKFRRKEFRTNLGQESREKIRKYKMWKKLEEKSFEQI